MDSFKQYNTATLKTDLEFKDSNQLFYISLGISGEAGEICDHVKKHIRDDNGKMSEKRRELILKECGDVLSVEFHWWYLNKLARTLGSSIGEVAAMNIKKLTSRHERNKLHGSGDNR